MAKNNDTISSECTVAGRAAALALFADLDRAGWHAELAAIEPGKTYLIKANCPAVAMAVTAESGGVTITW